VPRAEPEGIDWPRAARWLVVAVVAGFATLGVWAMFEGEVPCEGQPPARHGSAACIPPEDPDSGDWPVPPPGP
jgi:hypothetical protein